LVFCSAEEATDSAREGEKNKTLTIEINCVLIFQCARHKRLLLPKCTMILGLRVGIGDRQVLSIYEAFARLKLDRSQSNEVRRPFGALRL